MARVCNRLFQCFRTIDEIYSKSDKIFNRYLVRNGEVISLLKDEILNHLEQLTANIHLIRK